MKDLFHRFAHISGLSSNETKDQVAIAGVKDDRIASLIRLAGFVEGDRPLRYLRVNISASRLPAMNCQMLVDKIIARI